MPMKPVRSFFYFILLFVPFNFLFASADVVNSDTVFTRDLLLSADYGSNKIFLGRSSSINQVYLSPAISYDSPSGFFGSIIAYHLLSPRSRWDELDLNVGWGFFLFKKKLESSIGYTYMSYGKQSQQLSSVFNHNAEVMLKKNFGYLKTKLFFDFDFGNGNSDYSITLDNSIPIVVEPAFTEDDQLKIKPLISISAGTLNFYRLHLKSTTAAPVLQNILSATVDSRFNLTGIEFSLPVEYNIGRFSFEPAIHHNIPLNQPKRFRATSVTYFTASISFAII